jgi:predicted negative regulator of RcsB-dependent stress response
MKKLLIIVVSVVAVVVIAGLSANHYKNYQNKQAQAHPVVSLEDANRLSEVRVNEAKTAAAGEYNSLVAECQKGATAYAKLTTLTKTPGSPPLCPAAKN